MSDQELEVKYYVIDLQAVQQKAQELGAELSQPCTHELNLRFDTPESRLTSSAQALRLRRDQKIRLTYKGPPSQKQGVRVRQEIEFEVSDFNAARQFLQALGFQVAMIYEKHRTIYDLDGVHITLDEMPYGSFVELEGPDPESIQSVNQRLGLNWSAGVSASYTVLFSRLCQRLDLPFRDLIFEYFEDLRVTPADLDVIPADQ